MATKFSIEQLQQGEKKRRDFTQRFNDDLNLPDEVTAADIRGAHEDVTELEWMFGPESYARRRMAEIDKEHENVIGWNNSKRRAGRTPKGFGVESWNNRVRELQEKDLSRYGNIPTYDDLLGEAAQEANKRNRRLQALNEEAQGFEWAWGNLSGMITSIKNDPIALSTTIATAPIGVTRFALGLGIEFGINATEIAATEIKHEATGFRARQGIHQSAGDMASGIVLNAAISTLPTAFLGGSVKAVKMGMNAHRVRAEERRFNDADYRFTIKDDLARFIDEPMGAETSDSYTRLISASDRVLRAELGDQVDFDHFRNWVRGVREVARLREQQGLDFDPKIAARMQQETNNLLKRGGTVAEVMEQPEQLPARSPFDTSTVMDEGYKTRVQELFNNIPDDIPARNKAIEDLNAEFEKQAEEWRNLIANADPNGPAPEGLPEVIKQAWDQGNRVQQAFREQQMQMTKEHLEGIRGSNGILRRIKKLESIALAKQKEGMNDIPESRELDNFVAAVFNVVKTGRKDTIPANAHIAHVEDAKIAVRHLNENGSLGNWLRDVKTLVPAAVREAGEMNISKSNELALGQLNRYVLDTRSYTRGIDSRQRWQELREELAADEDMLDADDSLLMESLQIHYDEKGIPAGFDEATYDAISAAVLANKPLPKIDKYLDNFEDLRRTDFIEALANDPEGELDARWGTQFEDGTNGIAQVPRYTLGPDGSTRMDLVDRRTLADEIERRSEMARDIAACNI